MLQLDGWYATYYSDVTAIWLVCNILHVIVVWLVCNILHYMYVTIVWLLCNTLLVCYGCTTCMCRMKTFPQCTELGGTMYKRQSGGVVCNNHRLPVHESCIPSANLTLHIQVVKR